MYQEHFGLYTAPFTLVPHLRFLYQSSAFEETMAHLVYGLEGGEDIILITGEIGAGKTLALHHLATHLSGSYAVAIINTTQLDYPEILKLVLGELGVETPQGADRADLLNLFKARIAELEEDGRRLLLVVDEAQNLSPETLEGVRMLTNLGPAESQFVQIILSGQPSLRNKIDLPDLAQLRQRIRVHYHLDALTRNETAEYIDHRLKVAGCEERIFDGGAVERIFRLSGGVPRLVNILADRAMLAAYVDGSTKVLAKHIEDHESLTRSPEGENRSAAFAAAASEQLGMRQPPPSQQPPHQAPDDPSPYQAQPTHHAAPPPHQGHGGVPPYGGEGHPYHRSRPQAHPYWEDPDRGGDQIWWRPGVKTWMVLAAIVLLSALVFVTIKFGWTLKRQEQTPQRPVIVNADTIGAAAAAAARQRLIDEAAVQDVAPTEPVEPEDDLVTQLQRARQDQVLGTGRDSGGTVNDADFVPAQEEDRLREQADTPIGRGTSARLEELRRAREAAAQPPAAVEPERGLYVHVGSFKERFRADRQAGSLDRLGMETLILEADVGGVSWFRVYTGPWSDYGAAQDAKDRVTRARIVDWSQIVELP